MTVLDSFVEHVMFSCLKLCYNERSAIVTRMEETNQVRHGNYHNYYGTRPDGNRADLFRMCLSELCKGNQLQNSNTGEVLHMLDVGCNSGQFTAAVKEMLQDVTIQNVQAVGVELDDKLCAKAQASYPDIEFLCGNLLDIADGKCANDVDPIKRKMNQLGIDEFDVVCCFSVLMYIHLNGGDDGLRRVLDYLCSKGRWLIVELQPWNKYRDQERRLRRKEIGASYPLYSTLKWKGGCGRLESYIKEHILQQDFDLLAETSETNEFGRKIVFFKKKF